MRKEKNFVLSLGRFKLSFNSIKNTRFLYGAGVFFVKRTLNSFNRFLFLFQRIDGFVVCYIHR